MKISIFYSLFIFGFLLNSCVSTKLVFNSKSNKNEKITKAFLIVNDVTIGEVMAHFINSLASNLERNNVKVQVLTMNAISLISQDEIRKKIAEFNADCIIKITKPESKMAHSKSGYYYDGAIYVLSIEKPKTEEPIWKASITTQYERNGIV